MFGIDNILMFLVITGLLSFSIWVFSSLRSIKLAASLSSFSMVIVSLLILWRVFQLNLDFGLVLSLATFFAGITWIIGKQINFKVLIEESRSYFWILLVIIDK